MTMKKGYKASVNGKCRNITYEVGKTYTYNGDILLCSSGFHYCENIDDVLRYYDLTNLVIFEIEDIGNTIVDTKKNVTDKFKCVRIIEPTEYHKLFTSNKFDAYGRCIKLIDLDDDKCYLENAYDINGNCISICRINDGIIISRIDFTYDDRNNKIGEFNLSGIWEKREYDINNNIIKQWASDGSWVKYLYENNRRVKTWTNDDWWETISYNERGDILVKETSNGYHKSFEYDENGLISKIEKKFCTSYVEFYQNGKLIRRENDNKTWYQYDYDVNGLKVYTESNKYWIKYIYNDKKQLIKELRGAINNATREKSEYDYFNEYKYDEYGNKNYFNRNGDVVECTFDAKGNQIGCKYAQSNWSITIEEV